MKFEVEVTISTEMCSFLLENNVGLCNYAIWESPKDHKNKYGCSQKQIFVKPNYCFQLSFKPLFQLVLRFDATKKNDKKKSSEVLMK